MNNGSYYSIAQWEIPTLAHKIIVIPCQSRDFPLSYAVIATIVHLLFHCLNHYFIFKFIIFNKLVCLVLLLKHTASYKHVTVLLALEYLESACKDVCFPKRGVAIVVSINY